MQEKNVTTILDRKKRSHKNVHFCKSTLCGVTEGTTDLRAVRFETAAPSSKDIKPLTPRGLNLTQLRCEAPVATDQSAVGAASSFSSLSKGDGVFEEASPGCSPGSPVENCRGTTPPCGAGRVINILQT